MNVTLSKRGDYVVRSAVALARAYPGGGYRKIREVVADVDVPQTFASQILADLVRAEIASSRAGKDGGYRLVRSPESVSLLELVEAGEGPLRSARCALGEGPCRWEAVCPLHETWAAATGALRDTLAKTSLAVLAARDEALESGDYPAPPDSHRHGTSTLSIEDSVQVELSDQALVRRLARAEPLLASCVKYGYKEAEELRTGVDPASLPWSGAGPAMIALSAGAPGTEHVYRVMWEVGGSRGPSSRFEGTLIVHRVDDMRTELGLEGRFRPPSSLAESDLALAERLSRTTVRTMLRELARELEQPARSSRRQRVTVR